MEEEPKGIQEPKKEEPQNPEPTKDDKLNLGQFKDPNALLKGYKEIQAAYTTTTQENKKLKEEFDKLKEQYDTSRYTPPQNYQASNTDMDKDFDDLIVENPRKAIENVNAATYQKMRIAEVLEEIQYENPDAFQHRYSYAQSLSQNPQYAHLGTSPVGVKKLFEIGDKLREQEDKKNASKTLEAILGGPVDEQKIAKLRDALGIGQVPQPQTINTQLGNVYMPDTSDTYRPGVDANVDKKKELDKRIKEATAEGDIDSVIEAAFGKALAE